MKYSEGDGTPASRAEQGITGIERAGSINKENLRERWDELFTWFGCRVVGLSADTPSEKNEKVEGVLRGLDFYDDGPRFGIVTEEDVDGYLYSIFCNEVWLIAAERRLLPPGWFFVRGQQFCGCFKDDGAYACMDTKGKVFTIPANRFCHLGKKPPKETPAEWWPDWALKEVEIKPDAQNQAEKFANKTQATDEDEGPYTVEWGPEDADYKEREEYLERRAKNGDDNE